MLGVCSAGKEGEETTFEERSHTGGQPGLNGGLSGGNPNGGNFSGGNPNGGNFSGGNSNGGNFSGGNSNGGNFSGENPNGGNFSGGNPNGGPSAISVQSISGTNFIPAADLQAIQKASLRNGLITFYQTYHHDHHHDYHDPDLD